MQIALEKGHKKLHANDLCEWRLHFAGFLKGGI